MVSGALEDEQRPSSWTEVWRFRELLRSLAARNLKVKYQRSVLGFVWTLLNPLLTLTVLVAVFTYIIPMPMERYWAFLLSSWFVWSFLLQMISTATYVMIEHAGLRRSVAFPSEVLVLGATASRMFEFLAELALVLVALVLFHHHGIPASFALLPGLMVIQVLLALGLMMPLAVLSVFYADVQHAVPVALMVLFYASPVFYSASMVPEAFRWLYLSNPIAGMLTLYQQTLYEGRFPSPRLLASVAATSLVIFLVGHAIFRRYRDVLAEIV